MEATPVRRTLLLILVAAALATPALPLAASTGDQSAQPARLSIGFHELPDGLAEGGRYDGALVVRVLPQLGSITITTLDPAGFLAQQDAKPNVRYAEEVAPQQLLLDDARPVFPPDGPGALLTPSDPQYATMYGPQQVRADLAWDFTLGDNTSAVCVVDTGVRRTHEDLGTARYLGGHDFVNNDADPADDQGHGTHVAGTAVGLVNNGLGVAGMGNMAYYAVKVLDSGGSGSWDNVAAGIAWCADHGIPRTVVSLSLGGSGGASVLADAVHYAFAQGKLVVAASGNGYCDNCVLYPAAYPEAVAVGCTTVTQASCDFTSKGPQVDVAAPGKDIRSTCFGSNTEYCTKSGTSMSTPHASGVMALAWGHAPLLTAADLWARVNETSEDLGAAGKDNAFGWGRIDAMCLLTNTLCSIPPPPPPPVAPIFVDDFETGTAAWTLSGLWHPSTCRASLGTSSLAYNKQGCPTTFDTGATHAGEAVSPAIEIPSEATYVRLRLSSWYSSETSASYDKKLVSVSADGGAFTQLQQVGGATSVWTPLDIDLSAYVGQSIRVKLRFDTIDSVANNYEGWYVDDLTVVGDVDLGPPTAPHVPRALAANGGPGVGEVRVTWQTPWHGGSPIVAYNVYRADAPEGPFTLAGTTTATSFVDGGLGDGTTISYRVTARNAIGESEPSAVDEGTTFALPGAPPTFTAAAGPGAGQITLSWGAAPNGGTAITSYRVLRADHADGPYMEIANITGTGYASGGLPEATRYHFRVLARNIVGDGPVAEADARTFARPTAPLAPDARPGSALFSVALTWEAPGDTGGAPVTSYRVHRNGVYLASVTGSTSYLDTGRDVTRVYHYEISAVNVVGEGPRSDEVCSRPSPWPLALEGLCETGGVPAQYSMSHPFGISRGASTT